MPNLCQLLLTCADSTEADKISKVLLGKKLVACVREFATKSQFIWKNEVENEDEVMLVMESREDLFDEIEKEVARVHSYDTPVLTATPVTKISKKAEKWLKKSLVKG
ncbi:divalent-cation tolerance protein CutA [Candidatus Parcubacteria bacterium]|nr:divalent-cation tolerance protein CutA [Candidatus Parcubacteria bacterium]